MTVERECLTWADADCINTPLDKWCSNCLENRRQARVERARGETVTNGVVIPLHTKGKKP